MNKKLCAIGVTHLLCDPIPMISGVYFAHLWLPLLQSLLQLFESSNELQTMSTAERKKQIQEEAEEELLVGLDDTPGKNNINAYKLRGREINKNKNLEIFHHIILYALILLFIFLLFKIIRQHFHVWLLQRKPHTDIFGTSIPDARCHLAKCLQKLTASHPNQVCLFIRCF